jgi:hypothetical protein
LLGGWFVLVVMCDNEEIKSSLYWRVRKR